MSLPLWHCLTRLNVIEKFDGDYNRRKKIKMKAKQVYYYKGVSGRYRFVTFEGKTGNLFTNEKMPVSKKSLKGQLKKFSTLQGKTVQYGEFCGKVIDCNPTDKILSGKYLGDGKYFQHPELLNLNHLVLVHWENGVLPGWFPFYKLKVL